MDLSILSSSFEMATVVKGLYNALSIMLYNPLMMTRSNTTPMNSSMNSPDFAALPVCFGWPARNRNAAAGINRFLLHTQMTT